MIRSIGLAFVVLVGASEAGLSTTLGTHQVGGPAPDAARSPELVASSRTIERSRDGLFYVDATVNGAPVRFVVDSGASVIVLSAADAARAAVSARDGVSVETAGGAAAMRRAQIRQVVLAGRTLSDVDAAIVSQDLPVSLLGQSALSRLKSVTFKGDQLVFD